MKIELNREALQRTVATSGYTNVTKARRHEKCLFVLREHFYRKN